MVRGLAASVVRCALAGWVLLVLRFTRFWPFSGVGNWEIRRGVGGEEEAKRKQGKGRETGRAVREGGDRVGVVYAPGGVKHVRGSTGSDHIRVEIMTGRLVWLIRWLRLQIAVIVSAFCVITCNNEKIVKITSLDIRSELKHLKIRSDGFSLRRKKIDAQI